MHNDAMDQENSHSLHDDARKFCPNPYPDPEWALFLDLDGTLFELAPRPQDVHADESLTQALGQLAERFDGAVAIVSGRPIEQIDMLTSPLRLPAAGLHGLERRDAGGNLNAQSVDMAALAAVKQELTRFAARHPGLLLEDKGRAVAVHYRLAPELAAEVLATVPAVVAPHSSSFVLQPGKMVIEVKPRGVSKGAAIASFMAEAPFAGRRPLVAGDDVTDEDAFALVRSLGGMAIRVGPPQETLANERIPTVADFRSWLRQLATR